MSDDTQHVDPQQAASATGPYGEIAHALWDNGYTPVPLVQREKYPINQDWQLRCDKNFRESEILAEAERYSMNNVGVVLGDNLVAIDVDTRDPERIAAVKDLCMRFGWWRAVRFGAKGFALFLYVDQPFPLKGDLEWSVLQLFDNVSLCPNLAEGKEAKAAVEIFHGPKQLVLPPSIHPDTGLPFAWLTDTPLQDIQIDDLPEVHSASLSAFVKELAEIGINQDRPRPVRLFGASQGRRVTRETPQAAAVLPDGAVSAAVAAQARRDSGRPRLYDYALLPHAVASWLRALEIVGIPAISTPEWPIAPLDYLAPRAPGNRSDVWRFVATWRETGISNEKLRQGVARQRACSIKQWDIVNDPDATWPGIRDHGNAVEYGEDAFDAFSFIVRLLTPQGKSTDWIMQDTSRDWRRWIMETLKASAPEYTEAEAIFDHDVGVFLPAGFGPKGAGQ